MKRALLGLGIALCVAVVGAAQRPGTALPPPGTGGIAAIDTALQKLSTNKRLLVIAAHPDDEDTPLLTLVSRGMGGEAAYLSLSRGDGGQNLIGDELGIGLGLIRTEELNAARRLDGGRQYFTRAFDFGFSRSIEETLRFWPKQALLEDAVRIIRRFRPQVVVAVFSGTPRDGHGQHQASGIVAREAFHLAGDPHAFPDLLYEGSRPWQPAALYQTTRFLDRDKTTLTLPTSGIEPFSGRSFQQIAVADRSLHHSQGTGALQLIGPAEVRVGWIEGGSGREAKDLFAGTASDLPDLAAGAADPAVRAELAARLSRIVALASETRARLSPSDLYLAVTPLATIVAELRAARKGIDDKSPEGANAAATLEEKLQAAENALAAAAGVTLDAVSDRETAPQGESAVVTVGVWNAGPAPVAVSSVFLTRAEGWQLPPAGGPLSLAPGKLEELKFSTAVLAGTQVTVPYFLRRALQGALYDWTRAPGFVRGEPFAPPTLTAAAAVEIAGVLVVVTREVTYRYRDETFGEIRHQLRVVPRVDVSVEPGLVPWVIGRRRTLSLDVAISSNASAPVKGAIEVSPPAGWKDVAPRDFALPPRGRTLVTVPLVAPKGLETGRLTAAVTAVVDGERFTASIRTIDYEHIRPVAIPFSSVVDISAMHLKLPALRSIGYILGASDRVPEYLSAVGLPIQILTERDLRRGDLSRYDAIVVGTRAYETDPALNSANGRLLDYVRAGGLVVVQYQQYPFVDGKYAPFPLEIARPHDRVTDETAKVTILGPKHAIFNRPNRIGDADWEGWVQERGLYFAHSWAPAYTPLLAMADPGEAEQKGSLLVARIGKGRYIYTGLAFFRQLPAGVPGAYRLFANLLAWKGKP